jgi:diadenosine tetraphosphate (Ap4A) HIT family hydrolase
MFRLHEKLAQDTCEIARLALCRVQLMNDCRFPWLILVPAREGITEIHQLWEDDKAVLWREIDAVSQALWQLVEPDKLNVGALGNLVPQLHIHIIARYRQDTAWPNPVWGHGTPEPYSDGVLTDLITRLQQQIAPSE